MNSGSVPVQQRELRRSGRVDSLPEWPTPTHGCVALAAEDVGWDGQPVRAPFEALADELDQACSPEVVHRSGHGVLRQRELACQRAQRRPHDKVVAVGPRLLGHALQPMRDNAGLASSTQMFIQFALLALGSGLIAPLLWDSLLHLALGNASLIMGGAILLLWQGHAERMAQRQVGAGAT